MDTDKSFDWHGYIDKLTAENAALRQAIKEQAFEVEQALGNALYGTDPATGNPLWGDHAAETLAREAAKELAVQRRALDVADEWHRLAGNCIVPYPHCKEAGCHKCLSTAAIEQARKEAPHA